MGPQTFLMFGLVGDGSTFANTPMPVIVDGSGVLFTGPPAQSPGTGIPPHVSGFQIATGSIPPSDYGVVGLATQWIYDVPSTSWIPVESVASNADSITAQTQGLVNAASSEYGFNGSSWDRIRIANVFKTVLLTAAGVTAIWTPAAGKKFRLMGYTISVAGTLAAAGVQAIQLRDSATVIKQHNAAVQSVISGDTQIGADLGQGELSAVANNVLNGDLSTAMATGSVAINVWGTEE